MEQKLKTITEAGKTLDVASHSSIDRTTASPVLPDIRGLAYPPFEVLDGDWTKGFLLVCDHASSAMPTEYGTLGLSDVEMRRRTDPV